MLYVISVVVILVLIIYLFMNGQQFGNKPKGARLQRIQSSQHYRDGQFQNLSVTPQLTDDATMLSVTKGFFFGDKKNRKPPEVLPSQKTNLYLLPSAENILVWFGHSSYFMRVDGLNILIDPVFSGDASPLKGANKSFAGSDVYTADDMPQIDILIITHDHWDHLDYPTVSALKPKVKQVITALGVGAHLERWGYDQAMITEMQWGDEITPADEFKMYVTPTRHFSGRTFKRNGTLWVSFVLATPSMNIFIGGDSGYDSHFADIGAKYGPFDLAILENGQYNRWWKYIHMMPEETVQAAIDLKTNLLFPVHWGKFALSLHDWDEPIKRVLNESIRKDVPLIHPMIGAATNIKDPGAQVRWWESL